MSVKHTSLSQEALTSLLNTVALEEAGLNNGIFASQVSDMQHVQGEGELTHNAALNDEISSSIER